MGSIGSSGGVDTGVINRFTITFQYPTISRIRGDKPGISRGGKGVLNPATNEVMVKKIDNPPSKQKLILGILLLSGLLVFIFKVFGHKQAGKRWPWQPTLAPTTSVEFGVVNLERLKAIYEQDQKEKGFLVLDLRNTADWETQHIAKSVNFKPKNLQTYNNIRKLDSYFKLILVAEDTMNAKAFADKLKSVTWEQDKHLFVLKVPVTEWFEAGYPSNNMDN